MPILLLTPVALSVLPLLVQCAPWDLQQRDLVITETLTSTFQETATMTSFTAVLSTSSPSTDVSTSPSTVSSSSADVSSPASTAGPEAILFFPPGALPDAIAAAPPSSSSQSSSSVQPAPSPVKEAGATPKPQVMAYYPDWAASTFPPEKIDYARFDWIDFAFAVPDQNFNLAWDGSKDAPDLLSRLVAAAHQGGKKVKLSVGGWTGSKWVALDAWRASPTQLTRNDPDSSPPLCRTHRIDRCWLVISWRYTSSSSLTVLTSTGNIPARTGMMGTLAPQMIPLTSCLFCSFCGQRCPRTPRLLPRYRPCRSRMKMGRPWKTFPRSQRFWTGSWS